MRWAIAAASLLVLVIGVALLIHAPDVANVPPGGRAVLYIGVVLVWGFVAVGGAAWWRRPENGTGRLMVRVGVLVGLTALQFFDPPALFAIGVLVDTLSLSALIHLLLAFPRGAVEGKLARRTVLAAYAAGALQFPALLVTECDNCAQHNPWLIAEIDPLAALFSTLQGLLALIALVAAVVVLLRRWRASGPLQRRGLEPVLLLGAAILVLGLLTAVTTASGLGIGDAMQVAFFSAFALVPAAFLLGLQRTRFFRAATVGRVIERLSLDPRGVRDALAAELKDPDLVVAHWLPERGAYVDREGRDLPEPAPGRVVTEIDRDGRRVGALVHDAALCDAPELLRDATAAAALALENARLEVELRARLEALRASRSRLVEAGDAERRRLGRDLHDGAQQRLVALMIELQLARERFDADPAGA
ncbi:MAG TPA: histidine kinase dimerization/phosphoacceptor domain-containing protein, partial [Solirubrobacter sp.]|nr:histidine kinase dimerization/phosphoacceptor domain-containing protein [Solirubrobacter sp.]